MEKIDQIIEKIPIWRNKSVDYKPIYGGITNQNFKVVVEKKSYFVSIAGNNSELLGLDLFNKFYNNRVCEKLNLSPKIIYFLAQEGVLISEFFPYHPLSSKSLQNSNIQKRLIITLKTLHNGPNFLQEFDMFDLIKKYLKFANKKSIVFPAVYEEYLHRINLIGKALEPYRDELVPCHNDLVPENLLDSGHKIYLIDFDYSGQNDLCFDIGNLCIESNFNDMQVRELLKIYFGQINEEIVSRTHLHGILSDIGWSLWSFIQDRISSIDFDFNSYGLNRWKRAANKIDSGSVDRWLQYI